VRRGKRRNDNSLTSHLRGNWSDLGRPERGKNEGPQRKAREKKDRPLTAQKKKKRRILFAHKNPERSHKEKGALQPGLRNMTHLAEKLATSQVSGS